MAELVAGVAEVGGGYEALSFFPTSVDLLLAVDPTLREQKIDPLTGQAFRLYPWQCEVSEFLCKTKSSSLDPLKYCLCAANGSGKDAFVLAPHAVWFACTKIRALYIITSASGVQLSQQTERYITGMAEKTNAWCLQTIGRSIFKINQRHITCELSGSHILLFATDEEGKAEGYHPLDVGTEMAIAVNEAKSVAPEIFRALRRCTGYNVWLNVSTPGAPRGDFYESWNRWENKRRVTYYDCLRHQSPKEFQADKEELGEHSALFRSKWLAEFTYEADDSVIPQEVMERHLRMQRAGAIKKLPDTLLRFGLDIALSTDGDESVLTCAKGNAIDPQIYYRIKDATQLVDSIEADLVHKYKLTPTSQNYVIRADSGGAGSPVIDIMRQRDWRVIRTLNNSKATNPEQYKNKGAEMWYRLLRMLEENTIILPEESKLIDQLLSRRFKHGTSGIDKKQLEHKKEAIAHGRKSPDRADSLTLALADLRVGTLKKQLEEIAEAQERAVARSQQVGISLDTLDEQISYGGGWVHKNRNSKMVRNNLRALMAKI